MRKVRVIDVYEMLNFLDYLVELYDVYIVRKFCEDVKQRIYRMKKLTDGYNIYIRADKLLKKINKMLNKEYRYVESNTFMCMVADLTAVLNSECEEKNENELVEYNRKIYREEKNYVEEKYGTEIAEVSWRYYNKYNNMSDVWVFKVSEDAEV